MSAPRIGTRLTGSRFEIATTCEGALALPPSRDAGDKYSTRGKAVHLFIDEARRFGRAEALTRVVETWRDECAALDLDELGDYLGGWQTSDFETEVALAYSVTHGTARRVPPARSGRLGPVDVDEVPAIIDAVVWREHEGSVGVTDWKTGFKMVESPSTNPQPRFYALAAARLVDVEHAPTDKADALIVQIGEQGEQPRTRRAAFDELELDAIAGYVREVWQRDQAAKALVAEGKVSKLKLVEGSHCRRCPALVRCPAAASSAQGLLALEERLVTLARPTSPAAGEGELVPILTDEQASRGWVLLKAVAALSERMERALKAHVQRRGGITLPTGKVVRAMPYDVDVIDTEKALLLVDELGLDARAIVSEVSMSKAALTRALGKKETKAFVEQLRKRGGVQQAERTRYDEVDP